VLVDDELIYAFYDDKIPEGIITACRLRSLAARGRKHQPENCSAWKRSN